MATLWPHLESLKRACGCMRFELTDREVDVLEQLAEGKSTRWPLDACSCPPKP